MRPVPAGIFLLLCAAPSLAADPTLALPQGTPVGPWKEVLEGAGLALGPSDHADVRVQDAGAVWTLTVWRDGAVVRRVEVASPLTDADRVAVAWVASRMRQDVWEPSTPSIAREAPPEPLETPAHPAGLSAHPAGPSAHPLGPPAQRVGRTAHPIGHSAHPVGRTAHPLGHSAHPLGPLPGGEAGSPTAEAADARASAADPGPPEPPGAESPPSEPQVDTPGSALTVAARSPPGPQVAQATAPERTVADTPPPRSAPAAVASAAAPAAPAVPGLTELEPEVAVAAAPEEAATDGPIPEDPGGELPVEEAPRTEEALPEEPGAEAPSVRRTVAVEGWVGLAAAASLREESWTGVTGHLVGGVVLLHHLSLAATVGVRGPDLPATAPTATATVAWDVAGRLGWRPGWTWAPALELEAGAWHSTWAEAAGQLTTAWIPHVGGRVGVVRRLPHGLALGLDLGVHQDLAEVVLFQGERALGSQRPTHVSVGVQLVWRGARGKLPDR